jgi:cytochrome c-type biogenesis protein
MFFAGWWPSKMLNRERRMHHLPRVSILGAGALGFLFALGWTPCLGPTLGAILGLASSISNATALRGSILAFFYCLGLGIPFVVAALATEWVSTASSWLRRHQRTIGRIGGALLIVIGILEVSGAWHTFVLWLQVHVPSWTAPF